MELSSELRLPTTVIAVRLALAGRGECDAELFVVDLARPGRRLVDDLAALLDDEPAFIPVREPAGVRLVGKHAIEWVAYRPAAARDDVPELPELHDRQYRVRVELTGGRELVGMLLDSSPADRRRVVDHLNRARGFIRLVTADEHYLVNTRQIVAVTELSGVL